MIPTLENMDVVVGYLSAPEPRARVQELTRNPKNIEAREHWTLDTITEFTIGFLKSWTGARRIIDPDTQKRYDDLEKCPPSTARKYMNALNRILIESRAESREQWVTRLAGFIGVPESTVERAMIALRDDPVMVGEHAFVDRLMRDRLD